MSSALFHSYNRRVQRAGVLFCLGALFTAACTKIHSNPNSVVTPTPTPTSSAPPGAPQSLDMQMRSNGVLTLNWTDSNGDETGFSVERSTDDANYVPIAAIGVDAMSYSEPVPGANAMFFYRVRATNSCGSSNATHTKAVYLASGNGSSGQPIAGFQAAVLTPTSVGLFWQLASGASADYFQIQRSLDGVNFSGLAQSGSTDTSYTDSSVQTGTSYIYRIAAGNNASGLSPFTHRIVVTPMDSSGDEPPFAPSSLAVKLLSSSSIELTWNDNASDESKFSIYQRTVPGDFSELPLTLAANTTHEAITGLSTSVYEFYVVASNSQGDSLPSNTVLLMSLAPPATPQNFSARSSAGGVFLGWQIDPGAAQYEIERSNDGQSFSQILVAKGDAIAIVDGTAPGGIQLYYRMRALNAAGYSGYTSVVALNQPTGAPSGLSAKAVSDTHIHLDWTNNTSGAITCSVEKSLDGGTTFSTVTTSLPANTTSYDVTGLNPETTYSFRVRDLNGGAASAYSNLASATTLAPTGPAGTPQGLRVQSMTAVANGLKANVILEWDNTASGVQTQVSYSTSSSFPPASLVAVKSTSGASSVEIDGLLQNTIYYFVAFALSNNSPIGPSNLLTLTTSQTPPASPTGLAVATGSGSITQTSIKLTWVPPALATSQRIQVSSDGGTTFTDATTVSKSATFGAVSGLSAAKTYSFRVIAANAGGDSLPSSAVSAKTLFNAPGSAPSGLSIAVASGNPASPLASYVVTLSWTAPSSNSQNTVAGYEVYQAINGSTTFQKVASPSASMTSTQITIPATAAADHTYTFRVDAENNGGDSGNSNSVTISTVAPSGLTPTGVGLALASNGSVTISWSSSELDATGYTVQMTSGTSTQDFNAPAGATSVVISASHVTAGSSYTFVVITQTPEGTSNPSAPVTLGL